MPGRKAFDEVETGQLSREMEEPPAEAALSRKAAKSRKPTLPPLPSDSPMRMVEDDKLGVRIVLPPGPDPTEDESARRKEVLEGAGKYHEILAGVVSDYREFLSREVTHNRQLTTFQRAWLEAAGFQLQRAFDFLDVAIRGKV